MRKTDYMSKWKMGIGSTFLVVMLASYSSGAQNLASDSGDLPFVNLEAAGASSNQTSNQEVSSDLLTGTDQK